MPVGICDGFAVGLIDGNDVGTAVGEADGVAVRYDLTNTSKIENADEQVDRSVES